MGRRLTIQQRLCPDTPEYRRLIERWGRDASPILCAAVWSGCDAFLTEVVRKIDGVKQDDLSIERSITQMLVSRIRKALPPESPYEVEHGPHEFETMVSPSAQPPTYDIGFFPRADERRIWPVEAKLLRTDATVAEYVNEMRKNYLTCRYSPLSCEAAMLGYLLSGKAERAFENISTRLKCALAPHPEFRSRDHRVSDHTRKVPRGKPYPSAFRCHHMILGVAGAMLS